eukprot:CAMPEP_0176438110 /NCGR_PEP_ID=MMETSP0127-20121128/19073_1 /TAXON_ID=938130 /ORGANISM="Platyophrya macrostoma, Strain WH" /LENGTH=183 /DNA_ID=CAMNT_0017821967 /DNA_START=44 /DNA_END=595 /DNA_ORIENTATION=-
MGMFKVSLAVFAVMIITPTLAIETTANRCGLVTCHTGQSCCGPKSNSPTCFWLHNESCCASTAVAPFPTSVSVCIKGQSCCGTDAYTTQCYWANESKCCASTDSIASICDAHSSCCPTWGPPQMYKCCSSGTTCCSPGGGDTIEGACCAKDTTCCLTDTGIEQCCLADETCSTNGDGCIKKSH